MRFYCHLYSLFAARESAFATGGQAGMNHSAAWVGTRNFPRCPQCTKFEKEAGAICTLGRRSNKLTERASKVKKGYYVFVSACETEKQDSRNLLKWLADVARIEPATPCLQSRLEENTKVLRWCRLYGLSTKFSLSKCTEVVPSF
jgi:hypothetical protein